MRVVFAYTDTGAFANLPAPDTKLIELLKLNLIRVEALNDRIVELLEFESQLMSRMATQPVNTTSANTTSCSATAAVSTATVSDGMHSTLNTDSLQRVTI